MTQPASSADPYRRRVLWIVAGILCGHGMLLGYSATVHSPTLNEPAHLVAGLSYWRFGRFDLYRVNPPFTQLLAATPVVVAGYEEDWSAFYDFPGARPVFSIGTDFLRANGRRSIWLITVARWACIPISLAGGLFCYLWSRELWGSQAAGLLSLILWCLSPNILAHGALITPDCAAAAFGVGAGYMFWRYLTRPSWFRALAAGLLLGLAELAKLTWIVLYALWPVIWFIVFLRHRQSLPRKTAPRVSGVLLCIAVAVYVVNSGYNFGGSLTPLGDFRFVSDLLAGERPDGASGNVFSGTVLQRVPVPFPAQYVLGADVQKRDFEQFGQPSYLRGEWSSEGWWYYYLYGMSVKIPHGTQLLIVCALCLLLKRVLQSRSSVTDVACLLIPTAVVIALVSINTGMNHHFRYVLPTFGYLFVMCGIVVSKPQLNS